MSDTRAFRAFEENVERRDIDHVAARGIENGKDVSAVQRTWKSWFWDSWDKGPEERKLVFKTDCTLLLFACLGTFVKYLDRVNLTYAFVSGMEEELNFYGNQVVNATSFYTMCSCLALWPMQLIMTRVSPRYFVPFIELGWALATFGQSQMHTASQLYALRSLIGIFESAHFSCMCYLFGAWYQKNELGRRIGILNACTAIGPMFAGYLQAAAYEHLDGVRGLSGWRWLFIVDGVIGLGVLIPQFFLFPDVPARQGPDFVFTERDIELARDRNPVEGRVKQGRITWTQVKRWFATPEIWALWFISACNSIGFYPSTAMPYWFKAWNTRIPGSYSVAQIDNYSTTLYGMDLFQMLLFGWLSDTVFRGRRWPGLIIGPGVNLIIVILLAATPVFPEHNRAFRFFLYTQTSWGTATSTLFWAWTNEVCKGDPATRAFAGGGLNVWASVFSATIPLGVFQTVQMPAVVAGNWTAAGFLAAQIIVAIGMVYWLRRKAIKEERVDGVISVPEGDVSQDEEKSEKGGAAVEVTGHTTPVSKEISL
ncbi:hypothetical protein SBRCBS47491_002773 [Sporothrix bragantina]|uniref:Major facilitator superfamily (MFS) profile domain-containing protein n=1 Tax=Sporothrix bragantina TaxID=671064 RepID=A0ABP0B9Y8_9PEZI